MRTKSQRRYNKPRNRRDKIEPRNPLECPYFDSCNAPKCPLDPDYKNRVYIKGEPKCKLYDNQKMVFKKNKLGKLRNS